MGRGGGKGSGRKGGGGGTGRSSARGRVVRGRGRTTGLRGLQNTATGGRGKRARERAEAATDDVSGFAADADINLRGIELDGDADLAVLGEGSGFELSQTDLSSPAQPLPPAPSPPARQLH
jgi:hypothetical protein